ncbi:MULTISPECIES: HEAT repeat domain-containing protein [unclassified Tolypothrix]|uniref:Phycoerythrobilin lyase subunit CpeF n=2 Tax=Nostocales TaxID=1161 RepID=Q9KJG7_MICDP|nr:MULTISPECIES: HEAT repeat domain-containing protein [unclassified Tolypothrix]BAY89780.1 HEAT repeat-containing PBS lyase [Microchaete diplosiphon NIES-3275]AAF89697.1 phycoerythrobilin lyase subunit CpeF [Tolypothrix sp. PCC 7601]MBE9083458.1 HEAT repeat domain-containing protein [Tolypothrix sp. LEGE 11397]UYD30034.1 HEAT repeat domain-containing protein [Tolypothrix sp. PCC 7712]UYD33735.1 HEAT repeat domain-containing protein [Tolypothrix sp. PCC 7601]
MSQSLNSEAPTEEDPILRVQAENDALVERVNEQITLETFDATDKAVLKQLVEGLGDPRGLVRLRFAETLGEIGEPATPFLVAALANHANVVVRRAAAKTLTIISDPRAVPNLLDAFLNDEDTVVRSSAAGALARTGEASVPALLEILASDKHPQDIKGHAAWALAFIGSEAADYLYQALNAASLDVRCAVIGALGHVAQEQSDEKSCNLLVSALTDPEALIRTEAAAALGQVNYPPSVPHLILAIHDTDLDVRKAAINSLGKIGDRAANKPLQALLNDEQEVVRVLAKLAIAQIERQSEEDDW